MAIYNAIIHYVVTRATLKNGRREGKAESLSKSD